MHDDSTFVPSEPVPLAPVRVSLQYLFVWTTVVAAFMAIGMAAFASREDRQSPLLLTFILTNSLVYGGCLAAWLYAWKRWRGSPIDFPTHPGHFFALLLGVQYVGTQWGMILLSFLNGGDFAAPAMNLMIAITTLIYMVQGAGWFVVYRAPFNHRVWKFFCMAIVLWCAALIFGQLRWIILSRASSPSAYNWMIAVSVPQVPALISAVVAAIVAIIMDLRGWRRYDWLHWLGVGTLVYIPLAQAAVAALAMIDASLPE